MGARQCIRELGTALSTRRQGFISCHRSSNWEHMPTQRTLGVSEHLDAQPHDGISAQAPSHTVVWWSKAIRKVRWWRFCLNTPCNISGMWPLYICALLTRKGSSHEPSCQAHVHEWMLERHKAIVPRRLCTRIGGFVDCSRICPGTAGGPGSHIGDLKHSSCEEVHVV